MIASMQAMREGQAVTLDDARRDDEFGQLARAIVEFSIRNQHHLEEVRRRKDDFQRLFDMVPCGISVQDREYRLLRWNHSFAVRYDPQPGNTCYEVYKGRTTPCPECSVQRTWEEGAVQCNQESRVNPDGTRDYWFVQTVPLFDKDGNVSSVMEMSIDMTLIHTLQHQLQASERTHKAIFDSIPNAVFLLDAAELTILDCNPASVKMYGRQRENELIGRGILDLFLPEEREQYASQLRAFTVFSGVTNIKADGTPLRVDIRSASAMIENRRVRILCATDVTERIEMEQKFIQAGKMATLGEMATGVAHELNQPLTVIKGAASYFLRKTRRSEPIAPETLSELSVEISGQVDRASDIINHMRAFGRKSDLALLDTDINGVVAQACDLFGRQLVVHGITLETSLAPALPPVLAIPNRLEQVIVNLILNARDAVEERVKSAPEPPAVIGVSTVMDGNTVLLSVWDTGTGIPAHLLNKIFEPFFTTKPVGKGTGLGLSIIYGLVKDFGGSISARNRDEGGALFEIRLPITRRGDLAPNAPADGTDFLKQGYCMDTSVRVLLVDDEPGIRHVLGALIRDFGYDVHTAESAREALEAFTANPFPIVVTDIRMPGMDGLALLERVRNQNPDTQVVMITGHGDMDNAVECLRLGAADFIAKPVNDDLLEHSLKRAAEQYSLREQIRRYTEHLEELVASRTRELLEAHRVAVVGETVACMAHTIKNLAAALEGSLFVLKQGMESGNREYLDDGWAMLEEDISRVRDKLLHLLRIGQQTELRECLVDPVQPVRHVVKRLEGRAASLSIALQFQDAADSDPIPLDAERLEGCLLNLVGNALEAFPAPGLRARPAEVRVEIARTPDALIYDVRDTGTGLSAEAAERLRDGLFTTKKDGTGFGLLGTRKALLEMGGRLLWENLPDSGALFRIVLPLRVERTPAAAEANHLREDS